MKAFLSILFLSVAAISFGQTETDTTNYDDSLITITGSVIDTTKTISFYNVMVINKTVGKGIFGNYDGSFKITVKKTDKIGVSVSGYKTQYFSFKNKPFKENYNLTVYLDLISVTSAPIEVTPIKTLQELQEERAKIAKRELPKVTVTGAIQSPITALYMTFSKREKTKRLIAELEYRDQQRAVVKEILRVYVSADVIDLEAEEFDDFITFLNLNDQFLKSATDYELILYIKQKFEHFRRVHKEEF